jgi:hypothetical protein
VSYSISLDQGYPSVAEAAGGRFVRGIVLYAGAETLPFSFL